MMNRQEKSPKCVNSSHQFSFQIIIFPEGTCTNRSCLITFKPGAFYPGVPVQPVCIRYPNKLDTVTWTWEGPGVYDFKIKCWMQRINTNIPFTVWNYCGWRSLKSIALVKLNFCQCMYLPKRRKRIRKCLRTMCGKWWPSKFFFRLISFELRW